MSYTTEQLTLLIRRLEANAEQLQLANQLRLAHISEGDFEALQTAVRLTDPVADYAQAEVQEWRESVGSLRGVRHG